MDRDRELREFVVATLPSLRRVGGRLSFFGVSPATLDWAEQELEGRRSQIAVVDEAGQVMLSESVSIEVGRVDLLAALRPAVAAELGGVRVAYPAVSSNEGPLWTAGSGEPAPWQEHR